MLALCSVWAPTPRLAAVRVLRDAGVLELVAAVELWRRQIEQPVVILID